MNNTPKERITVPSIIKRKGTRKITALTAYDFSFAKLLDAAEIDIILVGDSVSSIVQGLPTTLPVTLDQMVYHCQCVSRAVSRALVVGDLPFMSYQVSAEQALQSAGRLVKEGNVGAVKLEGGERSFDAIKKIVSADIPVMGHIGLTPQSFYRMGGHKKQGKSDDSRSALLRDAQAVEDAGAFSVVLEGLPEDLAAEITNKLSIPTIGIAAGQNCDGQILVTHDMLGMNPEFRPTFAKRYRELGEDIVSAVRDYILEVERGTFPESKVSKVH